MTDLTRFTGTTQDVRGLLDQQRKMRSQVQHEQRKTAESNPLPKHKQGERFVRGPIPCDWLHRALACGGKSGNLALALWWLAGMQRCNPIRLTRQVARDFNISPRCVRRLLSKFGRAGLVQVARKRGRGPQVVLLNPSGEIVANAPLKAPDAPRTNANAQP
ncbi:MAG: hypothetical protein VX346_05555 [Planctomycetota bacterium]|nr:hypothetical protein [Planctomycetota bacterium]